MERRKGEKFHTTKIGDRLSSHTFPLPIFSSRETYKLVKSLEIAVNTLEKRGLFKHSSFRHLATFVNIVLFLNECQKSFIRVPPSKSKLTMLRIKKLKKSNQNIGACFFAGLTRFVTFG